jgi:hypothetical protein
LTILGGVRNCKRAGKGRTEDRRRIEGGPQEGCRRAEGEMKEDRRRVEGEPKEGRRAKKGPKEGRKGARQKGGPRGAYLRMILPLDQQGDGQEFDVLVFGLRDHRQGDGVQKFEGVFGWDDETVEGVEVL